MTKSYMYVLRCVDNTLYTGYTTDLLRRLKTHNAKKGAKYTRSRTPVFIKYFEEFETKGEALSAESAFKKKTRDKKEEYILENLKKSKIKIIEKINKEIKES